MLKAAAELSWAHHREALRLSLKVGREFVDEVSTKLEMQHLWATLYSPSVSSSFGAGS